ncbi:hypothetical protein PTTG_00435 [Puccinia triticina 1-1 BBBD Race 1]|uniref:Checkpoint protein n=3 Tax=Puccinia triticina TaxID=208348 RepID=A0A180GSL0_PUCT1|nr:uncharacterized protein PtA15_14A69 [Puccinia triticina]OAV94953.1 hypothetical protein PTTG_00435 [Puccinia triticina 1-1 BBBD Race 1]WAQ91188.1 hypothetical protein PtA15_14A69 [Puccinia triticina]
MRLRAHLANVATFTISTGDDEDGLRIHGTIKVPELFGSTYCVESNMNNNIHVEVSTQAFASAVRQTSSSPTEIVIRLAKLGRTPYMSFVAKTVGRSGVEYQVEQQVVVKVLKPPDLKDLPELKIPTPDTIIALPKISDLCKVAERLKSLSDLITISASRNGGFRLGITTEHARVETEWRGLHSFHAPSTQVTQDGTPRPTSAFYEVTVKSRGLLRCLHANLGEVSMAYICEGSCVALYNFVGGNAQLSGIEDGSERTGSLATYLPAVNEDVDD